MQTCKNQTNPNKNTQKPVNITNLQKTLQTPFKNKH